MVYDNEYNRMIAAKIRQIDRNHVQRINQISETNNHDIASPLEGMTLRNDQIHGGSGFASATVADLGFEPTAGATHTATGGGVSGGKRARAKSKIRCGDLRRSPLDRQGCECDPATSTTARDGSQDHFTSESAQRSANPSSLCWPHAQRTLGRWRSM